MVASTFNPFKTNGTFHTIKSGWSIVYIEGLHVIISKNDYIYFFEYQFVLANSADPDEMPPYGSFWVFTVCQITFTCADPESLVRGV